MNTVFFTIVEIVEPPQNQYVLVGTNVTFTCVTKGDRVIAYWILNGTSITISHNSEKLEYERLGALFTNTSSGGYYNLTLSVPATVVWNKTNIVCSVRDRLLTSVAQSIPVYLYVFYSLRKSIPMLKYTLNKVTCDH